MTPTPDADADREALADVIEIGRRRFESSATIAARGYSLLEKWSDLGWWEYGVSLRSGWFTDEAPARLMDEPTSGTGAGER